MFWYKYIYICRQQIYTRYFYYITLNLYSLFMKKFIFVFLFGLFFAAGAQAQVSVAEPEFAEQTLLLTSDSKGTLLTRENGTVKTKAGASLYLTGIGKVKSRLTVAGTTSKSAVQGGRTTRLIVKAKDNATDPQSFISIFKFEVKGKERRYQLAESGTLSKTESNNRSEEHTSELQSQR